MSVNDIFNFILVDDLVATGGQPSEDQFSDVRAAGYEVVINLAPDGLDTSLANEGNVLAGLGLEYHHIPVPWTNPNIAQLERFETVMRASAGRRTLVHCQANYRVTVFYALYAAAHHGWSEAQGDSLIARIWTSRPGYEMDQTWKDFIAQARKRQI